MAYSSYDHSAGLDRALAKWQALRKSQVPDQTLLQESILALAEVFVQAPLGRLPELVDRGLALAKLVRGATDSEDTDVFAAGIVVNEIRSTEKLRDDPSARLRTLMRPAQTFLAHGMMEEFALSLWATGDAQQQLERPMDASISYRTAHLICERLGLRQHLAGLLLSTAQMFRSESAQGRVSWTTTLSYFDDCYACLDEAPIEGRRRLRSACLIDRAPCYVEVAREQGSEHELRGGIARAERDTREGIALAKQDPNLSQYVRQGEMNLLRLQTIKDAVRTHRASS